MVVGREGEGAGGASVEDKLMCGGGCGGVGDPDLAIVDEEQAAAVVGEEGCVAFADDDGMGAGGERLKDDFEGRGVLEVSGVGGAAVGSGGGTVGVGDGGGVG